MSVVITFKDGHRDEELRFEDGHEGRDYRYVIGDNGTLSIFGKEEGGRLVRDQEPDIVYGPAAWYSVEGDARTKADEPKSRAYGA
ncbi:hypothetical protein ACFUS2_00560 [[Kitasatospora] papulosa]|uniref:hypothetical protein n=1 Tax=[Kitasatospora] papulosa TaxID=1464011 RepID=UPI00362565DE